MVSNLKKKRKNNKKNKQKKKQINAQFKKVNNEEVKEPKVSEDHDDDDSESQPDEAQDSRKRILPADDNDSDREEGKPKKKKKKKQLVSESATGTPDKKGKKSIRQMKREKHLQRLAEAQSAAKDQLKSQCISYLSQWKHDRQNWKFMKAKQVWLYKNKFSSYLVPDSSWPVLIEYFENAQGNIRKMLLDDANKVIKQLDEWTEAQKDKNKGGNEADEPQEETEQKDIDKPDETSCKRARDIIQNLSE